MKNKLNIFSNEKINNFLKIFFSDYEIVFMNLNVIEYTKQSTSLNIVIISNDKDLNLINFQR